MDKKQSYKNPVVWRSGSWAYFDGMQPSRVEVCCANTMKM